MTSLFVIIPGFGEPHATVKSQILLHNIRKLCSYKWTSLKVRVCIYDQTEIPTELYTHPCVDVQVCRSTGLPGNFIKRFAPPTDIEQYHVLVLYDDILLMPDVDLEHMLRIKQYFSLDIISPSLTIDSKHVYRYMLTEQNNDYDLKIGPCCELFCCLFDKESYKKYYEHVDPEMNPWLWGLDLILHKQFGFRVGIFNTMTMKHFFAQTSYISHLDKNPEVGYFNTMDKYGIDHTILKDQPCAFFYIKQSSRI